MLTTNERTLLYKKCKLTTKSLQKTLSVVPFNKAHDFERLLSNFSGKQITMPTNASDTAFIVELNDLSMLPRFLPGTLLVVEPSLTPHDRDFVLAYIHADSKMVFRRYSMEDGDDDVELETMDDDADPISLSHEDKIIGVVSQTMCEILV